MCPIHWTFETGVTHLFPGRVYEEKTNEIFLEAALSEVTKLNANFLGEALSEVTKLNANFLGEALSEVTVPHPSDLQTVAGRRSQVAVPHLSDLQTVAGRNSPYL